MPRSDHAAPSGQAVIISVDFPAPPRSRSHTPPGNALPAGPARRPVSIHDVLTAARIPQAAYDIAVTLARLRGTAATRELIGGRVVREADLARAMADCLGVRVGGIEPVDLIVEDGLRLTRHGPVRIVQTCNAAMEAKFVVPAGLENLAAVGAFIEGMPSAARLVRIGQASEIDACLAERSAATRADQARLSLALDRPEWSARQVMTPSQGFCAATIVWAMLAAVILAPFALLRTLHTASALLYFGCVLIRVLALMHRSRRSGRAEADAARAPGGTLPVYSVLVALHRERTVVGQLVQALDRLDWPRPKLEVMLVCEADDIATIAAAERAIAGRPGFVIVRVPPSQPRTKPKALNFALPLCTGDYVVLYDAEDRPDPCQLRQAHAAFLRGGSELACVQAPLVIRNGEKNWRTGLFALEYAALFRGLLPWLADHGLPITLGGTSNHFRRDRLVEVGAWDSHNVTEDADLGMRLCRHGYRIGIIEAGTSEEAPERWVDWRNQRTRWMKGWMVTWLVHMRNPARLFQDLGPIGFLCFQVLFFGMIASTIAQPFFFAFLALTAWSLTRDAGLPPFTIVLLTVDSINIVFGVAAFAALALKALTPEERRILPKWLWLVHAYWLAISFTAFRALGQLFHAPHHWEKTPHGADAKVE
ncbi:glycosyltransferase family 2 protein [Consotaella aegiceratis]|uniref:glycosyltransferase family 2 protein n=1 Tax=Consotaella aegiceratis TaxID=3097961 RepID=UPI002F402F9E